MGVVDGLMHYLETDTILFVLSTIMSDADHKPDSLRKPQQRSSGCNTSIGTRSSHG